MPQVMTFEKHRVLKNIQIPKLKEICPKEKSYYSNGTFYMIYKDDDNTFPNIGEIDEKFSKIYRNVRIRCYPAKRDTLYMIEKIMFTNIEKRAIFADLVEELSKLHNTENNKIKEVKIEHDKIEEIYNRYKENFSNHCTFYKFCYYWCGLCIALDFRIFKGRHTVIKRSLIVKDALTYLREQIKREKFGDSWDDVVKKIDPSERITDIKNIYVRRHEKNKNGKKIKVEPHVRLDVTTE